MFMVHINDILYVWDMHYDILSASCIEKCPYAIYTKTLLFICGIDKLSIWGIEKSVFVYIPYGHSFYTEYILKRFPYEI